MAAMIIRPSLGSVRMRLTNLALNSSTFPAAVQPASLTL